MGSTIVLFETQFDDVPRLATILFLRRVSGCDVISSCVALVAWMVAGQLVARVN